MKRWWLILVLALSLGVNLGIVSTLVIRHWTPKPPAVNNPGRALEQLVEQLDLDGEPRARFVTIQKDFYEQARRNHRRQRAAQQRLKRLLSAPNPDRQRIEGAIDELSLLYGERHRLLAEAVLRSSKILNRRQLNVYRRFLGRVGERFQKRDDRWGPRGQKK
ncbi:MAG: periplasmic heavy metal sensor [Deltaproteobacteria bacterium]|nr:periplasmic heavy metal sensor [Deltaproteobacteria bacterium]